MKNQWPGILVVVAYFLTSLVYNAVVPLWETPDEVGHFGYIVHIVQQRSLPKAEVGHLGEAHQPPLYYLLGALMVAPVNLNDPTGALQHNPRFIWSGGGSEPNIGFHSPEEFQFPYRGWALGLHLVRLLSSLLGTGTVWFVYRVARQIFNQQTLPALAAATIAFNPQFLFITSSANNDNLLAFTTTGLLWYTLDLQERITQRVPVSLRRWVGLGGWIWAILMTKWTGLAVVGVAVLALLAVGGRSRQASRVVRGLAVALLLAAVGTSWWWLRNWRLYGDPLGWQAYQQVFAVNLRSMPLTLSDVQAMFRTQYRSFWGVFGWMTVYAPPWFYRVTLWMGGAALLGWMVQIPLRRFRSYNLGGLLFLLAAGLAQEEFLLWIAQRANESMWQGRYLFPVVAPIAVLLAGGWAGWAPRRLRAFLGVLISLAALGVALFLALVVIRNAYAPPLTPDRVVIPNPVHVQFGDQFLLRGYEVRQRPGQMTVVLYWEALRQPDFDYSVFVHLMEEDRLIGQRDHPPGGDRSHPPTTWHPGELVIDSHPVPVPLRFSGKVEIRTGIYNWMTEERLPILQEGQPVGDWISLAEVSVNPIPHWLLWTSILAIGAVLAYFGLRVFRRPPGVRRTPNDKAIRIDRAINTQKSSKSHP